MFNLTGNRKMKILKSSAVSKLHGKCSYHVLLIFLGGFFFFNFFFIASNWDSVRNVIFLRDTSIAAVLLLTGSDGRPFPTTPPAFYHFLNHSNCFLNSS